jgi:hypothetical protein
MKIVDIPYGEYNLEIYQYDDMPEYVGYVAYINARDPEEVADFRTRNIETIVFLYAEFLIKRSANGRRLTAIFYDDT